MKSPWQSAMAAMGRHLPTCEVIIEQLSRSMDSSLPLTVRLKVKIHLMMCRLCRAYGNQIVFVRKAAREAMQAGHLPEQSLSAEAKERIKIRLRSEGSRD